MMDDYRKDVRRLRADVFKLLNKPREERPHGGLFQK